MFAKRYDMRVYTITSSTTSSRGLSKYLSGCLTDVNKPLTVPAHSRKQDLQNTPRERILLVKSKIIFTIHALHARYMHTDNTSLYSVYYICIIYLSTSKARYLLITRHDPRDLRPELTACTIITHPRIPQLTPKRFSARVSAWSHRNYKLKG